MGLLLTLLVLSGCKTFQTIEDPPEVFLCQFNGTPRAFYCENTVTKKKTKYSVDTPVMKAAQCLSADDYRSISQYIDYLTTQAEEHCQ